MERKRHTKKELLTDGIVLAIYTIALIVVSCFHEIWFDETQAWQIARSASYKELFTVIPHYEGHPPLWHLILSVFAKNGAPVDLSLRLVNISFCTAAMALLIFRSPFPKIVRWLLPFNFFFFYQFGVLNRPYSALMLAFFLAAITYKERNVHPWRYILSLVFMCLLSAFGIMIAGGLCLVWAFEIIIELVKSRKIAHFLRDKRFYSLCFILAVAVWLIITITPADDCYYAGVENGNSLKDMLMLPVCYEILVVLPFDSWSGVALDNDFIFSLSPLMIAEIFCGLAMWVGISAFAAKKKMFFTFFVPYFFISAFMAFSYMSQHHIGIGTLYHVFIFWIMGESEDGIVVPEFMKKLKNGIKSPFIRKFALICGSFICIVPIVYSGVSSVNDIRKNCSMSSIHKMIKENHLEDKKIMVTWYMECKVEKNKNEMGLNEYIFKFMEVPSKHEKITENKTYLMGYAAELLPYFDRNIFMNFNVDDPDTLYMHYKHKEDVDHIFAKWREKGLPDFLIGYCPIDEIYDEETLKGVKYLPIKNVDINTLYKMETKNTVVRIYMRKDLFDDYPQFKWVDDQEGNVYKRK